MISGTAVLSASLGLGISSFSTNDEEESEETERERERYRKRKGEIEIERKRMEAEKRRKKEAERDRLCATELQKKMLWLGVEFSSSQPVTKGKTDIFDSDLFSQAIVMKTLYLCANLLTCLILYRLSTKLKQT